MRKIVLAVMITLGITSGLCYAVWPRQVVSQEIVATTPHNVTWLEVCEIILKDKTSDIRYVEDKFDCTGYVITLRDKLYEQGIRSAFVEVMYWYNQKLGGHALIGFETEKGIVYIDVQHKNVAYVEINGTLAYLSIKEVDIDRLHDWEQFQWAKTQGGQVISIEEYWN